MNANVGRPLIGQWYARADKGEAFQVVGYDDRSHMIEIQSFDGDIDEIDDDAWRLLLLERSEQPENWTGPVDNVEMDDLGYSETAMSPGDWTQELRPFRVEGEPWEDSRPEEERDAFGAGSPREALSADVPEADERI